MGEYKVTDEQILDAIEKLVKQAGYPPTLRELMAELGLQSTSTIKVRLDNLRAIGAIDFQPKNPRTIRILRDE